MPRNSYLYLNISVENGCKTAKANRENVIRHFKTHAKFVMSTLSFKILPSVESHDHEVRILIDGNDILGHDYLGIDPPIFFAQQNLIKTGKLLIGRCICGCDGCGDYPINVDIVNDKIMWTDNNGLLLEFSKSSYEKTISIAQSDHSWEDKNRRVERLTSDLLKNTKTNNGYTFD